MNFIIYLIFLAHNSFSAAPAEKTVVLPPLKVTWEEGLTPKFVGVQSEEGVKIKKHKSVSLKRVKFEGQKTTLLFIPKDARLAPFKSNIPDTLNEFHVSKELMTPVKANELWLWGHTPKSKCRGFATLGIRFLNKKGLYTSVTGLFHWKLKLEDLPTNTAFYLLPSLTIDMPSAIKSLSFNPVEPIYTKRCELHSGGECPYVFSINKNTFGMNSQISFSGNTNKVSDFGCPI